MASQPKSAKQSFGWGGLLQQAVASVESRLDTILADEEDGPTKVKPATSAAKERVPASRRSNDPSRSDSGAKANDRLQERLARAMAKKKSDSGTESPPGDSSLPGTRPGSRGSGTISGTQTEDVASQETNPNNSIIGPAERVDALASMTATENFLSTLDTTRDKGEEDIGALARSTTSPLIPGPRGQSSLDQISATSRLTTNDEADALSADTIDIATLENRTKLSKPNQPQIEIENEAFEKRLQDELHPYIEKIDALQAKLQYLSREAAESAQKAAATARAGSAEKKLLEKDEKISLLMEEGQKLSKIEMKHLSIIKSLRAQAASMNQIQSTLKARAETAETSHTALEQRALRAEKKLETASANDHELEALRKEKIALSATVAEIKAELVRTTARAEATEKSHLNDLAELKNQNQELRDDLTSAKIERELGEEKLRREIRDLNTSLAREKERFNAMETEMLGEQAALEGKLESLRSRAEEVSSASQSDAQAKLLRQIETLQTQYSVAKENWHGIEGSLLTHIANTEKERDETTKREGDLRKKHRDIILKAKRTEHELEEHREKLQELERSLADLQTSLQKANRQAQEAEEHQYRTKTELDEQNEKMEQEITRRIEEERAKWTASLAIPRTDSPGASIRKSSGLDLGHLVSSVHGSRRPSANPFPNMDSCTPPRQNSTTSFKVHANGTVPDTPSIVSVDHDEYTSNGQGIPVSPAQTHRGVNDLISTSTVGAGPSVQLVERMSATVRRLETEKAASKDELARLTTQRDEARQEVVELMREAEAKRVCDERIKILEEEQRQMNERYQTTLELLGEKTELVEELKADVADVKQMYRDLVDSTMK